MASLLANNVRYQFSEGALKFLWRWLAVLGIRMPSWRKVRKEEQEIFGAISCPPQRHRSYKGNIFYVNSVIDILKHELANPHVMSQLRSMAEDTGAMLRELYHAGKWQRSPECQAPMAIVNGRHFFIEEFVTLDDGHHAYVRRFFISAEDTYAEVSDVTLDGDGIYYLDEDTAPIPACRLLSRAQFLPVSDQRIPGHRYLGGTRRGLQRVHHARQKLQQLCDDNHLKDRAYGRRIINVPIVLFSDDMSGNQSKRWNKHEVWYCYLGGLPFAEAQKEFNIHFLGTSNVCSSMELLPPIMDEIVGAVQEGFVAYDSIAHEEVFVVGTVLCCLGDNPMGSVFASHVGMKGSLPCRLCSVPAFDGSADSLKQIVSGGAGRSWEETKNQVSDYLSHAGFYGNAGAIAANTTETGVKDEIAQYYIQNLQEFAGSHRNASHEEVLGYLRSLGPFHRLQNPLFRIKGFDGHLDCPVEILHTVLLGPVKYAMAEAVGRLKRQPAVTARLIARANSMDPTGLYRPLQGRQMVTHYGSLVGKDYKSLIQCAPFIFHPIVDAKELQMHVAFATLTKLVFTREIVDINAYCKRLQEAVRRTILSVARAEVDLLYKPKFHLLIHLPAQAERFGPLLLGATEKMESFNHFLRDASSFTNRQAPSRDLARRFANAHALRHIVSGGYWKVGDRWQCAGQQITDLWQSEVIQKVLGFTRRVTKWPVGRTWNCLVESPLSATTAFAQAIGQTAALGQPEDLVASFDRVAGLSGDMFGIKNWVYLEDGKIGRVFEILRREEQEPFVLLHIFQVHQDVRVFGCPKLTATNEIVLRRVSGIKGPVNVQHNCGESECTYDQARVRHEREVLWDRMEDELEVVHADDSSFLLNIYCINMPWIDHLLEVEEVGDVDSECDIILAAHVAGGGEMEMEDLDIGIGWRDLVGREPAIHTGGVRVAPVDVGSDIGDGIASQLGTTNPPTEPTRPREILEEEEGPPLIRYHHIR